MAAEILTPTEKLKALRQITRTLDDELGKVVTYDDETTSDLLNAAEKQAVKILQTIHDGKNQDISHAVFGLQTGEKSVADLQNRMSDLSTKAIEIERVVQKLTDTDDRDRDIQRLEDEYQKLFTETLKRYG